MVVRFGPTPTNKTKYLRTAECKWCGHEFNRATVTRKNMSSCSVACSLALQAYAGGRVLVSKIHVYPCAWCGLAFNARNARIKYCSPHCASKSGYESSKGKRLAILRERYILKPPHAITCIDCGETSNVKGHTKRCPPCRVINARAAKRDANKKREAQKRGVDGITTECIKVAYIYDRDAWRCGVCGKRVDKALTYPHPMSASLDHIVPLAHSGTHTKANTQLAHLICNVRKSDRLDVQPLLFG
jgi:hypothetical protein